MYVFFFFKQKTAYELLISDWSSDVCSSDLASAFSSRYCAIMGVLPLGGLPLLGGGAALFIGKGDSRGAIDKKEARKSRDRLVAVAFRSYGNPKIVPAQIGRASCRERVGQNV